MKTLNDAMFAKAVAHAVKMMETEEATWNQENPVSQMFGGWNGEVMCPVNRAAFILTYGAEATIKITAAALQAIEEKKNRKANSQYAQHLAAATAPTADVFEIHVGDFMLCDDVGLKFDHENLHRHIRDFVHYAKEDEEEAKKPVSRDYKHVNERLVKIIRIEDHLEGFFDDTAHCLRNWKAQLKGEGEGYEGGSCTDDYGEELNIYNLSKDEQKEVFSTFYTLGVLVRDPSGRFVIIDPEGYEYPRYVLLRKDWRTMWAKDVAEAEREIAEAAENARKAEEERKAQERADYAALVARFDYLPNKGRGLTTAKVAQNLRAALKHEFPGVKFSVRSKTYSGGDNCHVTYTDGPASDKVKKIVDLFEGAFGNDYGYFSYTFLSREISAPLLQQIEEKVAERCPEENGFTNEVRRREVNDLLDRTDIPEGKALASVAWGDSPDFGHGLFATFAA